MRYIWLLLILSACASKTFIMPSVITSPEERNVLTSYPVIPVEESKID